MMTNHTQEPWYQTPNPLVIGHLHKNDPRDTSQVIAQAAICRGHTEDGSVHGSPLEKIGFDEAVANAARVVACVNGCEGIDPKAVPLYLAALKDLIHCNYILSSLKIETLETLKELREKG